MGFNFIVTCSGGSYEMKAHNIIRIILVGLLTWVLLTFLCGGCTPKIESNDPDWESCSENFGDHVCDFKLMDQHGNEVNLYDHYGKVIILDLSVMWCGPCQMAALDADPMVQRLGGPDKVVYVTVLIENLSGRDPSVIDLQGWATSLGIEINPVLAGSRDFLNTTGYNVTGWPTFYFIDSDMVLRDVMTGFSSVVMESKVRALMAEKDTGLQSP